LSSRRAAIYPRDRASLAFATVNAVWSDEHDNAAPSMVAFLQLRKISPPMRHRRFASARSFATRVKKRPVSTTAGTGKEAGGKPATGRLCQAGLRDEASVRHLA